MASRSLIQLLFTSVLLGAMAGQSADQRSEWISAGYDVQRTGWNRAEQTLSPANVSGMRRLWKTVLPNTPHVLAGLTPPLVVNRGDKQLVIVGGSDNHVFALDAETGERVWQADFTTDAKPSAPDDWLCPNGLTATPVIDTARSRVFAVASDGRLYGLALDDGRVLLPGVHFLPPFSKMSSLTYIDGVLYSTTSQDCNLGRSGVWAINPDSPGRVVRTFYSASSCSRGFCGAGIWGRAGAASDAAGHLYVATGDGPFDPAAGQWGMAVLQLQTTSLDVKDWFVPSNREFVNKLDLDIGNTSPVVFKWRDRVLVAVGGKEGVVYLMDAAALGGADHKTNAWTSPLYSNEKHSFQKNGIWGGIGAWTEPGSGRVWLYVPTYGSATPQQSAMFGVKYGDDPNGSVQAFTVEGDEKGAPSLDPQWRSVDMKVPDPVAITNGVVFALATGEDTTQATVDLITDVKWGPGGSILDERERQRRHQGGRATLYALDAVTGRQLWSSGQAIADWTHFSMPAVAGGRVFVTTNAGHVYAFGLGVDRGEHNYAPAGASPATSAPPPGQPASRAPGSRVGTAATRELFAAQCARCHGPDGQGLESAHTPNMHDRAWQRTRTVATIETTIRNGNALGMPAFSVLLTPQQIRTLALYVKALR
jgi:outer membrane protein assembly factor BamB